MIKWNLFKFVLLLGVIGLTANDVKASGCSTNIYPYINECFIDRYGKTEDIISVTYTDDFENCDRHTDETTGEIVCLGGDVVGLENFDVGVTWSVSEGHISSYYSGSWHNVGSEETEYTTINLKQEMRECKRKWDIEYCGNKTTISKMFGVTFSSEDLGVHFPVLMRHFRIDPSIDLRSLMGGGSTKGNKGKGRKK